jgi:hypothetical protein
VVHDQIGIGIPANDHKWMEQRFAQGPSLAMASDGQLKGTCGTAGVPEPI